MRRILDLNKSTQFLLLAITSSTALLAAEKSAIKPGDLVLVSVAKADLQVEDKIIVSLPLGSPIRVSVIKEDWLLDWEQGGWIHRDDVWTATEAERFFSAEIKAHPNAAAYHNRGLSSFSARRYEDAITDFTKALTYEPKNAAIYNSRGSAWQHKGSIEHALQDFSRAIELDSKLPLYYLNRSAARMLKGDVENAWDDANQAVELDSRNAAALNARGACWFEKDKLEQAEQDFNQAIEIAPHYAAAFTNRAALREKLGEYADALGDFEKSLTLDPAASTKNDLASLLLNCDEEHVRDPERALKLAIEACEQTLNLDWNALHTLAIAYIRTGENEKAAETLRTALALAPNDERTALKKILNDLPGQNQDKPAKVPAAETKVQPPAKKPAKEIEDLPL